MPRSHFILVVIARPRCSGWLDTNMQNGRIPFSPGRLASSWTPEDANPVMEICRDGFTACSRCTFPCGREMNKVLMVNGLTFGPQAVNELPRR